MWVCFTASVAVLSVRPLCSTENVTCPDGKFDPALMRSLRHEVPPWGTWRQRDVTSWKRFIHAIHYSRG